MAGRPPKATVMKILEGNPGGRPINRNEPKPLPGSPKPPKGMSKEARKEWNRIVKVLEPTRLLTLADRTVLEGYCNEYCTYQKTQEILNRTGILIPSADKKSVIVNPALRQSERSQKLIIRYLTELGLSPSSRARLAAGEGGGLDLDDDGLLD